MIKVIIAEDQILFREGLMLLMEDHGDIKVIGEANNGREALELVMKEKPHVVITDIQMPEMDGIELTKELKKSYPEIAVIALTMYEQGHLIVEMLESGAKGYVVKTASKQKLIEAIRSIYAGGYYFCDTTSIKLMKNIGKSKIDIPMKHNANRFTELEVKIIQSICQEFSSKEIADHLHIGIKTVESYRNKIFDKIGVKNMAGLVIYAIKNGFYDVNEGKPIEKPCNYY